MSDISFSDALETWFKNVKAAANLSVKEQIIINAAGAEVYKKALEEVTRNKHYSNHKDATYGHMADNIYLDKTNIDGQRDGSVVVGFDKHHAMNALYQNDGTKYIHGDHFVDNTRENVKDSVLMAERLAYKEIMKKKGAD
jgi:hypothetical protein